MGPGVDAYHHLIANGAFEFGDANVVYGLETIAQDIDDLEFITVDSRSLRIEPVQRRDERIVLGGTVSHDGFFTRWGHHQLGVEARVDALKNVGLSDVNTRPNTLNNGDADLYTGAVFYRNQYQWNEWLRHELDVRLGALNIDPDSELELDSAETEEVTSILAEI